MHAVELLQQDTRLMQFIYVLSQLSVTCDARWFSYQALQQNQVNQFILVLYGFHITTLYDTSE